MENESPPVPSSPPPLVGAPKPPPLTIQPLASSRRGRGWMIAALLLVVLLLVSLMGNARHFAQSLVGAGGSGRHVHHSLDKVTLEYNRSRNNILVVDINGISSDELLGRSGDSMVTVISDQLRLAGDDSSVKAVI